MNFLLLKHIHILSVTASFALLFIRGVWLLRSYPSTQERWVRVLPNVIDGLLMLSAIAMLSIYWAVAQESWMSAKFGLIVAYVALLLILTRFARTTPQKIAAWIAAMGTFLLITTISVLHHPYGIFALR